MLAVVTSSCGFAPPSRVVMEDGNAAVPSAMWAAGSPCTDATALPLMLMLKKSAAQAKQLEEAFWAVSEPDSPRYGMHLNASQLAGMVGASDLAIDAVVAWLREQGAADIEVATTKDAISATLSCRAAAAAFATELTTFAHSAVTGVALRRATKAYSLPASIAQHVSMVADLISLPQIRAPKVVSTGKAGGVAAEEGVAAFPSGDSCNSKCGPTFVTPGVISKAYALGDAPTTAKGSIAVAEFQGVDYDQKDLATYSEACGVDLKVTNVGKASGVYCAVPLLGTELCGEALLDIEYAGSLSGAIPLTDISNKQYSLLNWATQVAGLASPPLVHSVSYGNDEKQQTSTQFMFEANTAFMKLGALGISVLFAAGDQGVLGREGPGKVYHPDFPAGSPYITAVGGTDFAEKTVIGAEKAWSQGGGGFSDTFAMPDYQKAAVSAYLSAASGSLPPAAKWNATGRAYPDVSALGGEANPYCIHAGSMWAGVAGTSASSPVVASVIAKLNELRLAKGGKPLGFLNPWIYKVGASGFNDVKLGRNCGLPACLPTAGFPAVEGWDAATGFGSPNFEKLSALI